MKKYLKFISLFIVSILIIAGCQKATPGNEQKEGTFILPKTANIYLIALDDNGKNGKQVGCGDSVVPLEIKLSKSEQEVPIKAAIEHLLTIKTQKYQNLYNALYQSDLKLEKITSDRQNNTGIYLTGKTAMGGSCDVPRFEEQLKQTVLQFTQWVSTVQIYINGIPMEQTLSQK